MTVQRKLAAIALLAVVIVATTRCTKLDKGALSVIMSTQERHAQVVAEAFEKDTGIRVYMAWISSPETVIRLRQEKDNPSFSAWWGGTADTLAMAKKEGLLATVNPAFSADISPALKDQDGTWCGVLFNPVVIVYNPNLLKEKGLKTPQSWADVLAAEMKGQLVMANPEAAGSGQVVVRTLYGLGRTDGEREQLLKDLARNVRSFKESGVGVLESVAGGEAPIGLVLADEALISLGEKSTFAVSTPAEGSGFQLNGVAVIKGARQPEQANAFYEWALGRKAQELGAVTRDFRLPVVPEARRNEFKSIKNITLGFESLTSDTKAATAMFSQWR